MKATLLRLSVCAALLAALPPRPAGADDMNRLTYFTFSAAVQLPGMTLEPGTYEFLLVNPESGGSAMRVASRDGKVSKLFLVSRSSLLDEAPNDPIVVLRETPAGVTPALQAWFYPGQETGFEFIYSHRQAQALGMAHHATTLASTRILTGTRADQIARAKIR
jgi:hypothetical protein